MKRKKIGIILLIILLLAGCGKSIEEQVQEQLNLGNKYLKEQNYEQAIVAFTKAIEIDEKQVSAYIGRGNAYVLSDRTEENLLLAKGDYETALNLEQSEEILQKLAETYYILADYYISINDADQALIYLNQAYDLTGDEQYSDKISEVQTGISQWRAELTAEEDAVFVMVLEALSGGMSEEINDAMAHSEFISLVEEHGVSVRDEHTRMDYGNTVNGTGASFEIWRPEDGWPWIYAYYGQWEKGLANGKGILISIACDSESEAYSEQFEKAVGNWKDGFAEGDFQYEQNFYGGTQENQKTVITGRLKHGLWNGEVTEVRYSEDGEYVLYSTFVDGIAELKGYYESSWGSTPEYGINGDGELDQGVGGYNEYDAAEESMKGVIWSWGGVSKKSYDVDRTYIVTSLSASLAGGNDRLYF